MNKTILVIGTFLALNVVAAPPLLNGREVPNNHILRKSTVSLLTKNENGSLSSFCSGTVIGPRLVITAGHCVQEWFEGKIFIGHGTDPRRSKLAPVSMVKFNLLPDFGDDEKYGDIAVLQTDVNLAQLETVRIGLPSTLSTETSFLQAGYGYNSEEENDSWPFMGKLLMETNAGLDSINDKMIQTNQKLGTGPMRGDSGGPIFVTENNKLVLHGVLSSSGESDVTHSSYTHPHFAITWMNCELSSDQKVPTPEVLMNQIPCDNQPFIRMEDLGAFTKKVCEEQHPGWSIRSRFGCWPVTEEACVAYAREIGEPIQWNPRTKVCDYLD